MTPLQAEAEQLYPYPEIGEPWWLAIIDVKRAAHVACAEKYTAIIEDLKQKHEERILILALDMQKKDQEIERLRGGLKKMIDAYHHLSAYQKDWFCVKREEITALTEIINPLTHTP